MKNTRYPARTAGTYKLLINTKVSSAEWLMSKWLQEAASRCLNVEDANKTFRTTQDAGEQHSGVVTSNTLSMCYFYVSNRHTHTPDVSVHISVMCFPFRCIMVYWMEHFKEWAHLLNRNHIKDPWSFIYGDTRVCFKTPPGDITGWRTFSVINLLSVVLQTTASPQNAAISSN